LDFAPFEWASVLREIRDCWLLKSICIPHTVVVIGRLSFAHCGNLAVIHFDPPSSLQHFGEAVFSFCPSLRLASLPFSVETIGPRCFSNCRSLSLFSFEPNSRLTEIGESAFSERPLSGKI
jgi:hypothetical protein